MDEKVIIEDLLWSDIFKEDILSFTIPALIVILIFRVLANWEILRQAKAIVYLVKASAYGYLVILLWIYFSKENTLQSINVFTGFTFLFSAVEVVDNLLLSFEEWKESAKLPKDFWKKHVQKEEANFESMLNSLRQLDISIQPGRVNKATKKYLSEVLMKINKMSFYNIDSILQNKLGKRYCFTNAINDIRCSKMLLEITKQENKRTPKSLSFNKQQCEEFNNLIRDAIKYERIYYEEKERILLEKKNMDLV